MSREMMAMQFHQYMRDTNEKCKYNVYTVYAQIHGKVDENMCWFS